MNGIAALKAAYLKQIAFKCGISTTGTKAILSATIQHELSTVGTASTAARRVLSIDMGIRNLAYCVLGATAQNSGTQRRSLPSIDAWQRLAVSTAPVPLRIGEERPLAKETFDPATLSRAAYVFLSEKLQQEKPSHVLIERQRFRSLGSKHVLEWTVRVNMFESILHAVLHTLQAEGVWGGEVHAITPGKVGMFWLGRETDGVVERNNKHAKTRNKGRKIDLVRNWLKTGEMVALGNQNVESVAQRYREKWDRLPGRRMNKSLKAEAGEKMGKLDDLADSLLQGLAWLQWEENKMIAREDGVEALLDLSH